MYELMGALKERPYPERLSTMCGFCPMLLAVQAVICEHDDDGCSNYFTWDDALLV